MLDRRARPHVTRVLRGVAVGPLASVPAVAVTVTALGVGLAAAVFAARGQWGLALVGWLLNRLLDGLDGVIARESGSATDAGGYLDMMADVVVYAAVVLGVAAGSDDSSAWPMAAVLLASFYLNIVSWLYLSALWEKRRTGAASGHESTSITMPVGLIEGTETVGFFVVLLAVPGWSVVTMGVMATAVGVGALIRTWSGVRSLRERDLAPAGRRPRR